MSDHSWRVQGGWIHYPLWRYAHRLLDAETHAEGLEQVFD